MKKTNDSNNPVPRHLDSGDIISYLDGELVHDEQDCARAHLESCWSCRSKLLAMQNNIEKFLNLRRLVLPHEVPPSSPAVAQFRRRLAEHASVPSSLRLRVTNWLRASQLHLLLPDFSFSQYKTQTVAVALVGLVLFFTLADPFNWTNVSADELLNRAGAYEFLNEQPAGKVVWTKLRIERIALSTKTGTQIGQIETARDSLTSGIYISAELASGATLKRTLRDSDKQADIRLVTSDFDPVTSEYFEAQDWLPQISISSYRRLISGRGLKENDGAFTAYHDRTYELHHPFSAAHSSGITETVLFLNAQNYAPQGVSIFTNEGGEHFEYRLKRTSFERFQRTPELAQLFDASKAVPGVALQPETRNAKPESISPAPFAQPPSAIAATAELEVESLRLLNQIGADLGQEVIVTRIPGGPLKIEAMVDTEKRKHEILAVLKPIAANPAINIQVETAAEAHQRRVKSRDASASQTAPLTVVTESITTNSIPVQAQVRQYLLARGVSEHQLDIEVGRTANQIVMRSHRAMLHVWALKSMAQRFPAEELRTLEPDARSKWLQMIATHARGFQKEAAGLRQELAAMFGSESSGQAEATRAIADEAGLILAATMLIERASSNHEVTRAAFTISSGSSSTSAIGTPQFWRSLDQADSLAASIQSAAQRLR